MPLFDRFIFVCPYVSMGQVVEQENAQRPKDEGKRTMREVTKVRALLGVLAVLVLVAFVAGCGLVPDQGQARHEVKKKVEVAQEDLEKKVDDVQKDVNDLQKKVNELLKKIDAQQQQNQKEKK